MQLGLTTDDLIAVEDYAEQLRHARFSNQAQPVPTLQSVENRWKEEMKIKEGEVGRLY